MVTMQGDTPIPIGRAGKQRPGKLAGQLLRRIQPALGLAQDLERNWWVKLIFEESLMCRRIVDLHKAALDIEMCLHPVQIALTFVTFDGLLMDTQAFTDGFE